jgi:hypothetical protein
MVLAVSVRFDFVDNKGKTSFTKIRIPNGYSIPQYIEFGQAMAQTLTNISACRVTGSSATFSIPLAGLTLKTIANVLADTAQKAYFSFSSAVNGFFKRVRIPTFDETKTNETSDTIDEIDLDVAAFIAAMENGIVVTGATISPCTERVQDLVSLADTREVFRRKR